MFADRPPGTYEGPFPGADADTAPVEPVRDARAGAVEDETEILPVVDDEPPPAPPGERRRRLMLLALGAVAVLGIAVGIDIGLAGNDGHHAATPPLGPLNPTPSAAATATASGAPATSAAPGTSAAPTSAPPTSAPPTTAPSSAAVHAAQVAQARAVTALLARSAAARAGIGGAISSIGACKSIPAAVHTLDGAAAARTGVASDLGRTSLSALPGHQKLAADLTAALTASASADRHYAAWGRAVAPHCKKRAKPTADYAAAQHDDALATAAKRQFAAEWNPIATRLGVPPADPNRF